MGKGHSGLKKRWRWLIPAALAAVAVLPCQAARAGPADDIPAGMDEQEWERLRRPAGWREVPEFLSPEALAGLSQEVIEAIQRDFAERGRIQVQSDRYLDYDEQRNIIYSSARTRIRFDRYMIEADRVLVHVPLQEIQAEGNVILRAWRDPALTIKSDEIRCKSIIFNYKYFQGAAYEARGQHDVLYFKCKRGAGELPGFRIVGRDEVVFRDVEFTTCDFPDPQYSVRTRDAVLIFGDRLFLQRATLYVRHIPILYLPAYTKTLGEEFPWHITFGRSSRLGTYVNIRYNFWHYRYEPSFEDENEVELRDRGHARLKLDLFSRRGVGLGLSYDYGFDFEKHRGHLELYGLPSDRYRDVPGDRSRSRWQLFAKHRSQLRKDLILHLNVDYMSDPEVYYDLFDPLRQIERGRVPERRARAALTWWKEDYIARALFEIKQRITRDRITNTLEPYDDDFDYDLFPFERRRRRHHKREGLPSDRYGLVGLRLPHLQFSTSHIRIGGQAPLYYTIDVNAFNNLDKGLNFRSTDDDSFVLGLDIYQQLSYLIRFSERYTLLAQVGAGIGFMKRLDDSYHWKPSDFLREDGTQRTDIFYVDDDTFRTRYGREISLSDYNPVFAYGDIKLRFQGRFTDSLTGNIYYILREGVDDSLGEFYESIGNKTARTDLYNYRARKHWIEADLVYRLAYPDLTARLAAGRNLQSRSDIYANEPIQYVTLSSEYRNQARTLRLRGSLSYQQIQIRDPSDPYEYKRDSILAGLGATYAPVHRRWWVEGDLFVWKALDTDPARRGARRDRIYEEDYYRDLYDDDYYYFREDQTDVILEGWIGRKLGEKWTAELGLEYQRAYRGIRNARLVLTRDLHNALAQLQVRYRRRPWKDTPTDLDFKLGIEFKLPGPMDTVMAPRARVLMDERRQLELAEDPLNI